MLDKLIAMGFERFSLNTWKPLKKDGNEEIHAVELYHPKMGVQAKGKLVLQFPVINNIDASCKESIVLQVAELIKAELDKLPKKPTEGQLGEAKAIVVSKMIPIFDKHINDMRSKQFKKKTPKAAIEKIKPAAKNKARGKKK